MPVLSRTLKEVIVKVIEDPKPTQTSGKFIESVNTALSSRAGKLLVARILYSIYIVITADNY
jgi:hypothetical protein